MPPKRASSSASSATGSTPRSSTLPDDLRVVLVLSVLGERTSAEIGAILGRPPGTVRYQLSQARKRLAEQLGAVTA